jgi:hypothetical protein
MHESDPANDGHRAVTALSLPAHYGLSASASYLYYSDLFGNSIGRVGLAPGSRPQPMRLGLNGPIHVRYDPATGDLYFLETGTEAGRYKDGTLRVIVHH